MLPPVGTFFNLFGFGTAAQLRAINHQLGIIMSKQDEAVVQLKAANERLAALDVQGKKVVTEIEGMAQTIADLTAIIDAGGAGNTTPEFDAQIVALGEHMAKLTATMQAADDKNPDSLPKVDV